MSFVLIIVLEVWMFESLDILCVDYRFGSLEVYKCTCCV